MSIKEYMLCIKQHLDHEEYDQGLVACKTLLDSSGGGSVASLPPVAQFNLCSSYGLCALRCGHLDMAEEYCKMAEGMEASPAPSQKNLKNLSEVYEGLCKWREQGDTLHKMFTVALANANTKRMQNLAEGIATAYLKSLKNRSLAISFLKSYLTSSDYWPLYAATAAADANDTATHTHVGYMIDSLYNAQVLLPQTDGVAVEAGSSKQGLGGVSAGTGGSGSGSTVTISQRQIDTDREVEEEEFLCSGKVAERVVEHCFLAKENSGGNSASILPLTEDRISAVIYFIFTFAQSAWKRMLDSNYNYSVDELRQFCSRALTCLDVLTPVQVDGQGQGVRSGDESNRERIGFLLSASVAVSYCSSDNCFPSEALVCMAEQVLCSEPLSVIGNLILGYRDLLQYQNVAEVSQRVAICERFWRSQKKGAVGRAAAIATRGTRPPLPTPSPRSGEEIQDTDTSTLLGLLEEGMAAGSSFGFTSLQLIGTPAAIVGSMCAVLCAMLTTACPPRAILATTTSTNSTSTATPSLSRVDASVVMCAEAKVRFSSTLHAWIARVEPHLGLGGSAAAARLTDTLCLLNIAAVGATSPTDPCVLSLSPALLMMATDLFPSVFKTPLPRSRGDHLDAAASAAALLACGPLIMCASLRLLSRIGCYSMTSSLCDAIILSATGTGASNGGDANGGNDGRTALGACVVATVRSEGAWCRAMAAVADYKNGTGDTYMSSAVLPSLSGEETDANSRRGSAVPDVQLSLSAELLRDTDLSSESSSGATLVGLVSESDDIISTVLRDSNVNHTLFADSVSELHYRCGVLRWVMGGERRVNAKDKDGAMAALMVCAKLDGSFGPMYSIMGHFYSVVSRDAGRASKCYLKALSIDPSDAEAGVSICEIYLAAGDFGKATKLWDDVSQLTSNAYWAHATRGRYLLCVGRYAEAAEYLQRALEKRVGYESSWFELGLCYLYQRQYLAAHRALDKAHSMAVAARKSSSGCSVHPNVCSALGQVERHLCMYSESIAHFQLALSCYPLKELKLSTGLAVETDDDVATSITTTTMIPRSYTVACVLTLKGLSDTYLAQAHQRLTMGWTRGAAQSTSNGIECCEKVISIIQSFYGSSSEDGGGGITTHLNECFYKNLGDLYMFWSNLSPWDASYIQDRSRSSGSDGDTFTKDTLGDVLSSLERGSSILGDNLHRGEEAYRHVLSMVKRKEEEARRTTTDTSATAADATPACTALAMAYYDIGSALHAQAGHWMAARGQGGGMMHTDLYFTDSDISSGSGRSALALYESARDAFTAGLRKDPMHSGCWNGLGVCLIGKRRVHDGAAADLYQQKVMCFNRACQIDANAQAYANLGLLLAKHGDTIGARACFSSLQIMESNPLLWVALGAIIEIDGAGDSTAEKHSINTTTVTSTAPKVFATAQLAFDAFSASLEVMKPADGQLGHALAWMALHSAAAVVDGEVCSVQDGGGINQWSCDVLEKSHYLIELRHNVEYKTRAYLYRRPVCVLGWTVLGWALCQRGEYTNAGAAYYQAMRALDTVAASLLSSSSSSSDNGANASMMKLCAGVMMTQASSIDASIQRCVSIAVMSARLRVMRRGGVGVTMDQTDIHSIYAAVKVGVINGATHDFAHINQLSVRFELPATTGTIGRLAECYIPSDCADTALSGPNAKALNIYIADASTSSQDGVCTVVRASLFRFFSEVAAAMRGVTGGDANESDHETILKLAVQGVALHVAADLAMQQQCREVFRFLVYIGTYHRDDTSVHSLLTDVHRALGRGATLCDRCNVCDGGAQASEEDGENNSDLAAYFLLTYDASALIKFLSFFPDDDKLSLVAMMSLGHRSKKGPLVDLAISSLQTCKETSSSANSDTSSRSIDVFRMAKQCIVTTTVVENQLLLRDQQQRNTDIMEPSAAVDVLCGAAVLCAFDSNSNTTSKGNTAETQQQQPATGVSSRLNKKDLLSVLQWDPTNQDAWAALALVLLNENIDSEQVAVPVSTGGLSTRRTDLRLCCTITATLPPSPLTSSWKEEKEEDTCRVHVARDVLASLELVNGVEMISSSEDAKMSYVGSDSSAPHLFKQARQLSLSGHPREALSVYKQLLFSNGLDTRYTRQVWYELGNTYASMQLAECAEKCYNMLPLSGGRSGHLDNALCLLSCAAAFYARYVESGSKADATLSKKYIDECCSLHHNLAASLLFRSAVLSRLGDKSKSESSMRKAISQWSEISLPGYHVSTMPSVFT